MKNLTAIEARYTEPEGEGGVREQQQCPSGGRTTVSQKMDHLQPNKNKRDSFSPYAVKGSPGPPGSRNRSPATWKQRSGSPTLQAFESAGQHEDGVTGFVRWPQLSNQRGSAEERAAYFSQLHVADHLEANKSPPIGKHATTLLELMTIRAYHSRTLRRYSLGTALGLRTKGGELTSLPAIVVFVARKVHEQWLLESQKLPSILHGPGGFWCDVDVVEFSYYGPASTAPREQVYTELVEGLRGKDPNIGPGSQVASEEMYGTLGAVVRSREGNRLPGFLTNRHVAVDFDQPKQRMYHPLPPSLGPGIYLGSVERATSFTSDYAWYGIFAGEHAETFVRADGAFIPFWENFDLKKVTTSLKGIGHMGKVYTIDLNDKISSLVGHQVFKLGGSSGLTKGSIMAYAVEYNDDKGVCFFGDFLILGENGQPFDIEGDSGSLIVLEATGSELPRPVGIIWGGTANRGRLKLRSGNGPENWTSGVDIGRLLDLLELDLITTSEELRSTTPILFEQVVQNYCISCFHDLSLVSLYICLFICFIFVLRQYVTFYYVLQSAQFGSRSQNQIETRKEARKKVFFQLFLSFQYNFCSFRVQNYDLVHPMEPSILSSRFMNQKVPMELSLKIPLIKKIY